MREMLFEYIYKFKRDSVHVKKFIKIVKNEYLNGLENMYGENYELIARRQYAGIKYKKSVEIYEGDILKVDDFYSRGDGIMDDAILYVTFKEGCFLMEDEGIEELLYMYEDGVEVIGNIYENHELLHNILEVKE